MPKKNIQLNQETQGTVAGESHRSMVTLPEGCKIALVGQVAGHPEMVEVNWEGQSVWLFAIDFEARTKSQAPKGDNKTLLARATSVGASTPEPAHILLNTPKAKGPGNTAPSPKVRRYNAAGKELF